MHIDFLREGFERSGSADALVWKDRTFSYAYLLDQLDAWEGELDDAGIEPGFVVAVEADFSPKAIALMLALIDRSCLFVPLSSSVEAKKSEFREVAEVEFVVSIDDDDGVNIERTGTVSSHPVIESLKELGHPGLVLFSSGSTGKSKAAVHDFVPMLEKYKVRRHTLRTITFLLFDHIGGVNTLLYNLSNGGCVVTVPNRHPKTVCQAIDRYRVELLPTSPTFLNLMLVSGAYSKHDLSSLKTVTYGTEVMPQSTLARFHEEFPDVRPLQTYGLSEVGILRSKSRSSDSLWVRVGGEGFETRVVDGLLEIKAQSAMLGYLNAPSPFTEDGWFMTGDAVEVDGEYIRILGRRSELINVGGEKVFPAEVESVIQTMEGVEEVVVAGEANPLTGNIVVA
ncbi:MAG: fatty acid--CoA ligase family protein, partial [Proteobacteria bacterium]|nr:fatty acid--CoA ligase family protein [Pseudomonadota bacterium]